MLVKDSTVWRGSCGNSCMNSHPWGDIYIKTSLQVKIHFYCKTVTKHNTYHSTGWQSRIRLWRTYDCYSFTVWNTGKNQLSDVMCQRLTLWAQDRLVVMSCVSECMYQRFNTQLRSFLFFSFGVITTSLSVTLWPLLHSFMWHSFPSSVQPVNMLQHAEMCSFEKSYACVYLGSTHGVVS